MSWPRPREEFAGVISWGYFVCVIWSKTSAVVDIELGRFEGGGAGDGGATWGVGVSLGDDDNDDEEESEDDSDSFSDEGVSVPGVVTGSSSRWSRAAVGTGE